MQEKNGRKFTIPESFFLFGRKYTVIFVDSLAQDRHYIGLCDPGSGTIQIQKSSPGHIISSQDQEQTFFHELTHAILDAMNERELYSNEKFVDIFGCLLHQIAITAK